MSQTTTKTATATQALRDLIADVRSGQANPDDLDNELLRVEEALGLPFTAESPDLQSEDGPVIGLDTIGDAVWLDVDGAGVALTREEAHALAARLLAL